MNLKNTYFGFTDNLKPMQKAKVEKTLDKLIRYNGNIYTEKEFVYLKLSAEGAMPELVENYQYIKRDGELSKPKNDYRLNFIDPKHNVQCYSEINKTLYEYANHILKNNFLDEQKAEQYIAAEQERIQAKKQAEEDRIAKEKTEKEQREQEQKEFENWLQEQVINYNSTEKIELIKEIFIDEVGQFNDRAIKLLVLIENFDNQKCKDKLREWLGYYNKASLRTFFHLTGINLGSTDKAIQDRLNSVTSKDFQGIVPFKKKQVRQKNKEVNEETFYIRKGNREYDQVKGVKYKNKYGLDLFLHNREYMYCVTELRTGVLLAKGGTKKEVAENLKELIEKHTLQDIEKRLDDILDRYGVSPNCVAV